MDVCTRRGRQVFVEYVLHCYDCVHYGAGCVGWGFCLYFEMNICMLWGMAVHRGVVCQQ